MEARCSESRKDQTNSQGGEKEKCEELKGANWEDRNDDSACWSGRGAPRKTWDLPCALAEEGPG